MELEVSISYQTNQKPFWSKASKVKLVEYAGSILKKTVKMEWIHAELEIYIQNKSESVLVDKALAVYVINIILLGDDDE